MELSETTLSKLKGILGNANDYEVGETKSGTEKGEYKKAEGKTEYDAPCIFEYSATVILDPNGHKDWTFGFKILA